MEPLIEDVVEELCIAEIFIDAKIDSGRRLALIFVDNVVELMLKAYGDTKLIGQLLKHYPNERFKGKLLSKTNWEDIKNQNNFNLIADWVLANSSSSIDKSIVNTYHNARNTLYHTAIPLSVEKSKAFEYLNIGKRMLKELFAVSITAEAWETKKLGVADAILPKPQPKSITFSKTDDGLRMEAPALLLKDTELIMLVIFGLMRFLGRAPKNEELIASLNYSGRPVENLPQKIHDLRLRGYVTQNRLCLKQKATNFLVNRFRLG